MAERLSLTTAAKLTQHMEMLRRSHDCGVLTVADLKRVASLQGEGVAEREMAAIAVAELPFPEEIAAAVTPALLLVLDGLNEDYVIEDLLTEYEDFDSSGLLQKYAYEKRRASVWKQLETRTTEQYHAHPAFVSVGEKKVISLKQMEITGRVVSIQALSPEIVGTGFVHNSKNGAQPSYLQDSLSIEGKQLGQTHVFVQLVEQNPEYQEAGDVPRFIYKVVEIQVFVEEPYVEPPIQRPLQKKA